MATSFACQMSSLDCSPLGRRKSETNKIPPSSALWEQSPFHVPTLQSPGSDESLAVSPISPQTLSNSSSDYALLARQAIEQKGDLSLLYKSSFEDWMEWDMADNTLYSPMNQDYMNVKLEAASPIMETLKLSGRLGIHDMSAMMGGGLDDSSAAFQHSTNEEPLFQEPQDMPVEPNNEILSNQVPWPQSVPSYESKHPFAVYPPHSRSKTSKLKSINTPTASTPMLPPTKSPKKRPKRKSTSSATSSSSSASSNPPPRRQSAPVMRIAHNMIEKRYRTNLNDKIAALRDSVPSLRLTEQMDPNGDPIVQEDLDGLEAAQKLNKATILSKAIEYIAHLEKGNIYLKKECQLLKDRIEASEILLMSASGPARTSLSQQNLA